jgi:hypothetical protein
MASARTLCILALSVLTISTSSTRAANLEVTAMNPARGSTASVAASISITFDRALLTASIDASSFRVFGRQSGTASGSYAFSNGNRTITFTHPRLFAAGETVVVTLAHTIQAADLEPLRPAGFEYAFITRAEPSTMSFAQIDLMSNRINGVQTRIYGASAADLNGDTFLDLATVNEVSADVRVFLNRGDRTGLFHSFLTPQGIGVQASPNETADFNNDGRADLCIAAVESNSIWVLLGAGNGTFSSAIGIPVGVWPHGVAVLDVDGDGDTDIINSNTGNNNLSLLVNNGSGSFAAPVYFDSGTNGEYGLVAADMNDDGISDLVVTSRDGQQIVTMLGNGNGTLTAAGTPQSSGGHTWVVAVGDVNGDGRLDAAVANSTSNNGAILLGNGNGRFGAPTLMVTGAHTVASDLGDLDGDGDLDWVLSSFGGGFWRIYRNELGSFALQQQVNAVANPSCAIILDFDNDRDLDLALSDEIADVVGLWRNAGTPTGVEEGPAAIGGTALANLPDPFRAETVIRFRIPTAGDAVLRVFDGAGRQVASRSVAGGPAGWRVVRFDGRGSDGHLLPNGVYYYQIRGPSFVESDRMVIVR